MRWPWQKKSKNPTIKYTNIGRCKRCHHQVSWQEKMHSHGTCPYCGNTSGGTVVDTYKEVGYWSGSRSNRVWNPTGEKIND